MKLKGYVLGICMLKSVLGASSSVKILGVGSLRDTGSVRCGAKVTFICSIPTYKYAMKWLIASDEVAECVTTNCVQYPPYKVDNIRFSTDTCNGEFNMTINPVTLKADGRKVKCRHGSEGVELKMAVKVLPTKTTTKIVESKDDNCNVIKITAVTGCVFPSSAITMLWYYYEEGHIPKLYKGKSPIKTSNFSVCSAGPCGGNGVVKLSSTLSIPDERNGKEYYFQIAIRHEDTADIILVNTSRSYRINEVTSECRMETCVQVVVMALAIYHIFASSMLIVTICLALKLKRKNSSKEGHSTANLNTRNKNKGSTKVTRSALYEELEPLDDPERTKEEENNGDIGKNSSIAINKTKQM